MKQAGCISRIFEDGRGKALLVLLCSVAVHASAFFLWEDKPAQPMLSSGAISAPVSLSFSTVTHPPEPEPEPVIKPEPTPATTSEIQPEIVEKAEFKVARKESESKEPEPVPEEPRPEPQPEPEKIEEPIVATQPVPEQEPVVEISATAESDNNSVSDIPVVYQPTTGKRPKYPRQARRRNQEGTVMLEVLVDANGETLEVDVFESSGFPLLDRAAIRAVSQWTFPPKIVGNEKVQSTVHVPVLFKLES